MKTNYKEQEKKKVCIGIPIYKTSLSKIEEISLKRCFLMLSKYDIFLIQPQSLDLSNITSNTNLHIQKFHDLYFKDILGYNKLMLTNEFYNRFSNYKYLLIHQLDCYVFDDHLLYWCNKNYDYIGSPWMTSKKTLTKRVLSHFDNVNKKRRSEIFFKVGNGGFSLRKIESFCKITKEYQNEINLNLKRDEKDYKLMEDVFWSIKAPQLDSDFKIPDFKIALNFSIDRKPKLALKENNNKLPFGCHGINKPKVVRFWKKIIPEMH